MNDRGQVVGNPGGPALWTDARKESLPWLPVPDDGADGWTAVAAINDLGQAVGWSGTGVPAPSGVVDGYDSTLHRAVLWTDEQVVDLGTLRTTDSEAYAINDCGMILGESSERDRDGYGVRHHVLWYAPTSEKAVSP
jgi:uncharacterized membrane protein